jgi:hypothetical protein
VTTTTPDTSAAVGDRPPLAELPAAAVLASWAYLRTALHRPQLLTVAVGGFTAALLAAILLFRLWWALLAFPGMSAVGIAAMFAAFVLARRGAGDRMLLMSRTSSGRAGLILHPRTGADGPYWLLDNMWARPRGPRPVDRAQRPGAVQLGRAIALADHHDMPLRLVAADQALAAKVYLPAGFGYADDRQRTRRRPRMTLAPRTR